MTHEDAIAEGWGLVVEVPGIGCIYRVNTSAIEQDDDDVPIETTNDEGEEDETVVPSEIWMVVAGEREMFTKSGERWARRLLTDMTKDQLDLFA